MTVKLLQTKGDYKARCKNLILKYLSYHSILQAKYSHTLD